MIFFLYC